MSNATDTVPAAANDDTADFGSMIELDLDGPPTAGGAAHVVLSAEPPVVRGVRWCECSLTAGRAARATVRLLDREVCATCSRPRHPVPTRTTRPVDLAGEQAAAVAAVQAPAEFATLAQEAAHNAASAGLVRGGVLPGDVNPVAGYNVPVIAARGQATRYTVESAAAGALRATGAAPTAAGVEYLTHGQLIAGVQEGAIGGLVSWSGLGSLTRGQILETLAAAGLDAKLAPKARTAHAQAGHVLNRLNLDGYVVRAIPVSERKALETWRARWNIARVTTKAGVGESAGSVAMVADLDATGVLTIAHGETDGDSIELSRVTRDAFARRVASEIFTAAEVTDWLAGVVRTTWRGVKLGGSWFVPSEHVDAAEALCTVLSRGWGTAWMVPAIPLTNSGKLRASLAGSLVGEAAAVLGDLQAAQLEAAAAGKPLGDKIATNLQTRLETVRERIVSFAAVLGADVLGDVRARVQAAIASLDGVASDISQRFALIFEELAR